MEMTPLAASKSVAVKEAAPLVEPSAAASWMERVPAENESGLETVAAVATPAAEV